MKLPELREGDTVKLQRCIIRPGRTQPPKRYNEASLLTQMEKHGLGTPATRADIIEKLLSSETIERRVKHLVPTAKGKQLIELVAKELRSPELTAKWEQELESIARGTGNRDKFMIGIREQAAQLVRGVKTSEVAYKPHNLTHSKCPECSNFLLERSGKRGKMLVCSNRECEYRRSAEPAVINMRCPQCKKKMELHTGKAGKYAQCRRCNVIEMLGEQGSGGGGGKGGRANKRNDSKLAQQYSDNETVGNSLADALKAAMERNQ
ncbi:DNA topoisomerase 1 [compost metagenome]